MALDSSFSATTQHGSNVFYDYCCLSCSEDNRNSDAEHFCQDCSQCYCNDCLQLHNKLHKRHVVYGREDVDQWSTATTLAGPLIPCEKHPANFLEVECMEHRQLCCSICMSVDHK